MAVALLLGIAVTLNERLDYFGTTINLGANNLFDTRAHGNGRETAGISPYYPTGALGRFLFVRVRKDF